MQDPNFTDELRLALKQKRSPVARLQKTLKRRRLPDYFRFGKKLSLFLHLSVVVMVLVHSLYLNFWGTPQIDKDRMLQLKEQKSAIRVEVLDLPTKKVSELRKVDVSQKAGDVDKKEATKKTPKDAMVLEKKKDAARNKLQALQRKRAAIERLRNKNKKEMAEGERAVLAGNRISEGYSVTGDIATDRDVHSDKVRNHVLKYWNVPAWMAASKQYQAEIVVKLAPNGSIVSKEMIKKSGNEEFDSYAMQAIEAADPFPAPPDSLKRLFLEEGILCAFPE